ncbi:MAG: hypothetical protein ABR575_03890 [Actinomycetota bacterium]
MIPARMVRLVVGATAVGALLWALVPPPDAETPAPASPSESVRSSTPSEAPSQWGRPAPSELAAQPPEAGARPHGRRAPVGYAIAVPELQGLPPDASPGTHLEVWVAWDPPVTDQPRIQRLLPDVVLQRIVAPTTPGAPPVALLLVPRKSMTDLLWGDRYGALSVTVP